MKPPRILFIPSVHEDRTSDRSPALLRLLRRRHNVVTLPFPWDRYIYDPSRAKAPRYLLYVADKLFGGMRGVLLARETDAQLTFCETPHHALVGLWVSRIRSVPCVWDSHGNAALAGRSLGKGGMYIWLTTALDRFLGRRVDVLLTVSKADAEAYNAMGVPAFRIHVIPTSVDVERVEREAAARMPVPSRSGDLKTLVFFGSFQYAPNRNALTFINDRLAPFLEKEGLACEILIAGRDVPEIAWHPSVRAVGFVENLHAWIRSADLCVVPIWQGVGILTKVVDAMATGTPVVLSRLATMGIPEIRDGVHALVADSPEQFPKRVADALRDPEGMRRMAENARALIRERYDWRVQEPLLEEILNRLSGPTVES